MAFLIRARARTRCLLALAWLLAAGGCATTQPLGYVDVLIYDCGAGGDACTSADGGGEHVKAQAFVDPSASRYAPEGLYTYFELPRADGVTGVLELDVPTQGDGGEVNRYRASYRELAGAEARFESSSASGEVTVSSLLGGGPSCGCDDGAFALRFVDPGKDQKRGTRDDRTRLLAYGRFGWSEDFCRTPSEASVPSGLRVLRERCQAVPSEPAAAAATSESWGPPATSDATSDSCLFDCYQGARVVYVAQADQQPYGSPPSSGGGCGDSSSDSGGGCGDSSNDSGGGCGGSSNDSGGGCDGSSSDTGGGCGDGSSSGGGGACEGDTTDSPSSNDGCSGNDSSSSSSSKDGCGSDSGDDRSSCMVVHPGPPSRGRGRSGSRRSHAFTGTGLPLALTCMLLGLRAARLRARRCGPRA